MEQRRITIHEPTTQTIACSLDRTEAETRLARWQTVRDEHLLDMQTIPRGIRMRFSGEAADVLEDLAAGEAACCGFLRIVVEPEDGATAVEITGDPDAGPVIRVLAGLE